MKRSIVAACIGAMVLFCAAGISRAQTTAELDLVNANYFNPAIVDNGVYAGPYTAGVVNSNGTVSPTFAIICDNYDTDVSVGIKWVAEGVTLGEEFATPPTVQPPLKLENPLSTYVQTHYPIVGAEQAYESAAWMAQQIMAIGGGNPNSLTGIQQQEIADYNWAIWAIFSNGAVANAGGFDANAQQDLNTALGNTYSLSQFNDVTFWIPFDTVGGGCPLPTTQSSNPPCPDYAASQEYISVTPEPASLILFGTGLLGIAFAIRKKHLTNA